MTLLCGWLPAGDPAAGEEVIQTLGAALRVHPGQTWASWRAGSLTVGLLELPGDDYAPAATPDGRWQLWMAGEAFDGGRLLAGVDAVRSRTPAFREALLAALLRQGLDAVSELDGEYQIVLWDGAEGALTLLNDRFGGLPLYWGRSAAGFAFAGGVRGVLAAPGIPADPDLEAIREAVSFGGYRLGDRTNAAAVKMLPGAAVVAVRPGGNPSVRRSWSWADIPRQPERPVAEWIERAHELWGLAIRRRLVGSTRPGQTLSGGLDSRAILAEAAPLAPRWTAITYGVPGCDDARYAQRAVEASRVTGVFHPLYSGKDPDWLDLRTSFIQATDGLVQLGDLMHLESLPIQRALLDLHLSGYIGDVVCGPSYGSIRDAASLMAQMPFYGTSLSYPGQEALLWAEGAISRVGGAHPRYAIFDHKLPQSIHRVFQSYSPWFRVRKPFLDRGLFELFAGLEDGEARSQVYHRMLRLKYPSLFARIPNQKTGLPVLTPRWRVQCERARRLIWRKAYPTLARWRLPARQRIRSYTADELVWRSGSAPDRIAAAILRPGSLSCEAFGRNEVHRFVTHWLQHGAGPAQVMGALYVYETYHAGLSRHLRTARRDAAISPAVSPLSGPSR